MSKGFVYVLTNPSMPGLVKIGMTTRSVEERAEELYTSGVPERFEVAYYTPSPDCEELERAVHESLSKQRKNGSREFFEVSTLQAERVVQNELMEQVRAFVSEYTESHVVIEDHLAVDEAQISMLCTDTGRSDYEISSAIGELNAEDLAGALARWDQKVLKRKESNLRAV